MKTSTRALSLLVVAAGCASDPVVSIGRGSSSHATPELPKVADAGQERSQPTAAPTAPAPDPVSIDLSGANNPAGLSAGDAARLVAGGPNGKLKWLYPYEGTVFPNGMLPPTVMWDGDPTTDAVYVRIHSRAFEYKAVLKPGVISTSPLTPPQPVLRLDPEIWRSAGHQSQGKGDVFTLELSTLVHGIVAGPITTHISIATAPFRGWLYYQTYGSTLQQVANLTASSGDLKRMAPGHQADTVLSAGYFLGNTCHGCHSIAANGSRLVVESIDSNAARGTKTKGYAYSLSARGVTDPIALASNAAFAAVYPDGSLYLASSQRVSLAQQGLYSIQDQLGGPNPILDAVLYEAATAQPIPDTGIPNGALMPMFSPDGARLVFNDFASNSARGLGVMSFDALHKQAKAERIVAREPAGPDEPGIWGGSGLTTTGMRPAWPAFVPDNQAVVFVRTDSSTFSSGLIGQFAHTSSEQNGLGIPLASTANGSDLYIVDLATDTTTVLARAVGFDTPADYAAGKSYLPFADSDQHHNYFPTVSPVAAGGYYWIFFDSLRHYGNLGVQRQLWGAALDIRPDGGYTSDPSHPPFYLEGQELGPDNHRAFAALDLCRPDGVPCTTGIDCCTGYCSDTCSPKRDACAKRDERCASAADCCVTTDYCINGFCAFVELR